MSLSDSGRQLRAYSPLGISAPIEMTVNAMSLDKEKSDVAQRLGAKMEAFMRELPKDELQLLMELMV